MSLLVLGSLDMLTAFPWTDDHVKDNHSYPSKAAVRASMYAAMLEDVPQLLLNVAYFAMTKQAQVLPIVSCCLTGVQIAWTVFTKSLILEGYDEIQQSVEMRRSSRVAADA